MPLPLLLMLMTSVLQLGLMQPVHLEIDCCVLFLTRLHLYLILSCHVKL